MMIETKTEKLERILAEVLATLKADDHECELGEPDCMSGECTLVDRDIRP